MAKAVTTGPTSLRTIGLVRTFHKGRSASDGFAPGSGGSGVMAVDGVDLAIPAGGTFGIVGESGCGKSTLARCLVGLLAPTAGRILLDGLDVGVTDRSEGLRRRQGRIQMIFQDPFASLNPRWTVRRIVAEPLVARHPPIPAVEIEMIVAEALDAVGLNPQDVGRYPHAFSGGERQRIAVARALGGCWKAPGGPEIVVCDEPTASVDPSIQAQILNLMQDLQDRHGVAYLMISHNLSVIHHMAEAVGVMYAGRLVEHGPTDIVFDAPRHPYTQMLIAAAPDLTVSGRTPAPIPGEPPDPTRVPAGCAFHPRCPYRRDRCLTERPSLLPGDTGAAVACHGVEEGWPLSV